MEPTSCSHCGVISRRPTVVWRIAIRCPARKSIRPILLHKKLCEYFLQYFRCRCDTHHGKPPQQLHKSLRRNSLIWINYVGFSILINLCSGNPRCWQKYVKAIMATNVLSSFHEETWVATTVIDKKNDITVFNFNCVIPIVICRCWKEHSELRSKNGLHFHRCAVKPITLFT